MKRLILIIGLLLITVGCTKGADTAGDGSTVSAAGHVAIGDPAPDFSLPGYPHQEFRLADQLADHIVVLYFYPKDNTPDCTTEACTFRDTYGEFIQHGAVIVGVSRDDLESHALFADELDLPFPLLCDADGQVRDSFGNPDGSSQLIPRITYVIDRQGIVREIISPADAKDLQQHISLSLGAVKKLNAAAGEN
ncbi:peroxiredoxin [bacterium]|nr:peroxiredoxin [bacterium]